MGDGMITMDNISDGLKIVTSNKSPYFTDNIIGISSAIPTSGTYKVGDIIISSTQTNNIFGWVCKTAGTPGTWEVIKSGNVDLSKYATKEQLDEVFQNVSNGKNLVATAITDKGVSTSSDATFSTMASNINNIAAAKDIEVDGEPIGSDFELESSGFLFTNGLYDFIPYKFYNGSAVVYNNEIHILGGGGTTNTFTCHYKLVNSKWKYVSTLPFPFVQGSAVVYNNEIHILGGTGTSAITADTKHYKWNGTTWTSASTLPYKFYSGGAVVYNNEIHILGSNDNANRTKHYKWNGSSWASVSTLPYASFTFNRAVVFNNAIHILGTYGYFYQFSNNTWTQLTTSPQRFDQGDMVVFDGKIVALGGYRSATYDDFYSYHMVWDGTAWTQPNGLPSNFRKFSAVVFNNEILMLGNSDGDSKQYYFYDTINKTWHSFNILPLTCYNHVTFILNDEIHLIGGKYDSYIDSVGWTAYDSNKHYKLSNGKWYYVGTIPANGSKPNICATTYQNKAHVVIAQNHYTYDGTTWTKILSSIGFTPSDMIVHDNKIHAITSSGYYTYNGSEWTLIVETTTSGFNLITVLNNEIYISDAGYDSNKGSYLYKLNNGSWERLLDIPHSLLYGKLLAYNNKLYVFGLYDANLSYQLVYNNGIWEEFGFIFPIFYSDIILFNNEIHVIGGTHSDNLGNLIRSRHYKGIPSYNIKTK